MIAQTVPCRRTPAFCLLGLLVSFSVAGPAPPMPKGYVCYRGRGAIRIDGRLEERDWRSVPWTDAFVDIEGDRKPQPRFRTFAKMLWDDRCFYVAAQLQEPDISGTLTRHDSVIYQDNDFEVFIDPDGDSHDYYEFEINALNTGWDLFLNRPYKDGGSADNGWEIPGLRSAVAVTGTLNKPGDLDLNWAVEIAFPWKAFAKFARRPTPPRNGDQWRVNFSRVEWRHEAVEGRYRKLAGLREDNWVWSPQGVIDMHRPERWGYVQFSTARPGRDRLRPDPTAAARDLLHRVYYAQIEFRRKNGRFATELSELGLGKMEYPSRAGPATLTAQGERFQATVPVRLLAGKAARVHIREDARVWSGSE